MFARRLAELKARELALKLRSVELRGEFREELQDYKEHAAQRLQWIGMAGGTLGLVGLLLRLRGDGRAREWMVWLMLGLRARRLWRRFSADRPDPEKASSGSTSEPPASRQASPNP